MSVEKMPNQTSDFAFPGFFFASFYVRTNIYGSYSFLLRQKLKKFKSPSVNMFGESLHRALKVHLSGSGLSQVSLSFFFQLLPSALSLNSLRLFYREAYKILRIVLFFVFTKYYENLVMVFWNSCNFCQKNWCLL